jgi:hypothetical protein
VRGLARLRDFPTALREHLSKGGYKLAGIAQQVPTTALAPRPVQAPFLAPDLVKAAVDGRLPRGTGVSQLSTCRAVGRSNEGLLGLGSQNQLS